MCRRRLLAGMGWIVLSVPFYEYYGLPSMKTKARFLISYNPVRFAALNFV